MCVYICTSVFLHTNVPVIPFLRLLGFAFAFEEDAWTRRSIPILLLPEGSGFGRAIANIDVIFHHVVDSMRSLADLFGL